MLTWLIVLLVAFGFSWFLEKKLSLKERLMDVLFGAAGAFLAGFIASIFELHPVSVWLLSLAGLFSFILGYRLTWGRQPDFI